MSSIIEIKNSLEQYGLRVGRLQGEVQLLTKNHTSLIQQIEKGKESIQLHQKSVEVLTVIQKNTVQMIKEQFESLVTFALQYITQKPYQFILVFERRGNLQELNFEIKCPNQEESWNPQESNGGGINNIISFALRIVLAEISKIKGFHIFDEPFKEVSVGLRPRANMLLNELNKKLKRQIIQISHDETLKDSGFHKIEI